MLHICNLKKPVKLWVCVCECLFLMRSERASRVCIVVLEEVEEDEPSSSPPPPRPKSSPDRRSHHASRRAAVQEDKVRWPHHFPDKLIHSVMFRLNPVLVQRTAFAWISDVTLHFHQSFLILTLKPVRLYFVRRPNLSKYSLLSHDKYSPNVITNKAFGIRWLLGIDCIDYQLSPGLCSPLC